MTGEKPRRGRPPKGNELKSETLAIKTAPALKVRISEEARRNGRSLTDEVETRLRESLDRSEAPRTERTAQLLEQIAKNIFEIESVLGEKGKPTRWHENVAAWAAVREMLYHGPVAEVVTADAFRDEKLERLESEAAQIQIEKDKRIVSLKTLGIHAEAKPQIRSGLFRPLEEATANRDDLRHQVAAEGWPGEQFKMLAESVIDELEQLDEAERENEEARAKAVEYLREDIEKGRATYMRPPRNPALDHALHLLMRATFPFGGLGKPNALFGLVAAPVLQPRKPRTDGAGVGLGFGAVKRDDDSGSGGNDTP